MKSAVISFLLTLIAVVTAFLICVRPPSAIEPRRATAASTGTETVFVSSGNVALRSPGPALANPAELTERLDQLAAKARDITQERPIVENLIAWWDLVCEVTAHDPLRAIAMVREAPEKFIGDKAHSVSGTVEDVVAWWVARDPDAALAWYWKDAAQREPMAEPPEEIVQTLARRDVSRAIGFVREYLERHARHGLGGEGYSMNLDGQRAKRSFFLSDVLTALQPWIKTVEDFEAILSLADAIPDDARRAGFHQTLTTNVASSLDVAAAREFLEHHPLPADWPQDYAHPAAGLAGRAVATGGDPEEWIAWGQRQLPQRADSHRQLVTEVVKTWAARDPGPAGDWLQSYRTAVPAAAALAMRAYAAAVLDENPQAAMEWITALPDETARRQNMLLHFPRWAERDPVAARSWLAASPWPEEIKRLAGAVLPP